MERSFNMVENTKKQPLNEFMMAMDVVDTIRHRSKLISRELNQEETDKDLIKRLKKIYQAQGIEVTDEALKQGVQALREERFVYKPTENSFAKKLAHIYINRDKWLKPFCFVSGGLFSLYILYLLFIVLPFKSDLKSLPLEADKIHERIIALSNNSEIVSDAGNFRADINSFIEDKDVSTAKQVKDNMEYYLKHLEANYKLQIVSRKGERSGVWRFPKNNRRIKNYYLVVEPIDSRGKNIAIMVTNEENNKQELAKKFAVRVDRRQYENLKQDKLDDGIIQNKIIGIKPRGQNNIKYSIPVQKGIITEW